MMKRTIYIVWMLLGLCACQGDEPMPDGAADRRVYLAATVENAQVQSRVPYILTAPSLSNPLKVDVWASTNEKEFKDEGKNGSDDSGVVAYHTDARFTNGTEQLLNDVIYPKQGGNPVYFVGMHPQGWTTTDGKLAIYTFDGEDDVMFAPHISGVYGGNTTGDKWPTLKFHHLLTWLRIEMVAENEEVSKAWGQVKSLKVKSANQVTVDLSQTYAPATCVSFSGDTELPFYQTGKDEVFKNYTLKGPFQDTDDKEDYIEEVAYVLCAPVGASAADEDGKKTVEYTLLVETEKRSVEIPVDLMRSGTEYFNESTMNHQFTLLLNFKMGDNISVMAIQTDWKTGGIGSEDFDESDVN